MREIVYDYKDIDYIVSLTDSGVININKKNLEEAINEGYLEFSKILDSIESYEAEKMEREEWE